MQLVIYDSTNKVIDVEVVLSDVIVDGNSVSWGNNAYGIYGINSSFGIFPDGTNVNIGDILTTDQINSFISFNSLQPQMKQLMSQNAQIIMALVQNNLM